MSQSDGGYCSNCAALAAQLQAAQQQIAQLQREVQTLRARLQRLQQVLQLARAACLNYLAQVQPVLSKSSGVPRAAWSYCRGVHTVAAHLITLLTGGTT